MESNPSVRTISVAKKNEFEKEKDFENKRDEIEKRIQKDTKGLKPKKLPLSDKRRAEDTAEPERSVHFGIHET